MNTSLSERSLSALIWNVLASAGKLAAQFLLQIVLARLLGPDVYGQYALVLVVIGMGWLLADAGMGSALIQKSEIHAGDIAQALGWLMLTSSLAALTLAWGAAPLSLWLGQPALAGVIRCCGPIIVLQALSNLSSSLMQRKLQMKRLQLLQLAAYVVGYGGVAVTLALRGAGIWSLVSGFAVQTLIVFIGAWLSVRHSWRMRWRGDGALTRFGLNVLGVNLSNWGIDNLDRVLIGRIWGGASLGAYAAASNLSRAPVNLILQSLQSVVFASAARVQEDRSRLVRGFCAVNALVLLMCLPVATMLWVHADGLIRLLYGAAWQESAALFRAFSCALPFYIMLGVNGPLLWAVGAVHKELMVQLVTVAALLAALLTLAEYPLALAVWCVPFIFALRSLWLCGLITRQLALPGGVWLGLMRGGLSLSAGVALIGEAMAPLYNQTLVSQHGWVLLGFVGQCLWCLVALRSAPQWLLGPVLAPWLLEMGHRSPYARRFCRFLNLAPAERTMT
ncbi:MAG: oligosaccharide flippase family protein [Burkholderiaceae bacterium]|nr:oligosaccharide flippase family protein [Burkholderiaceae bacterium]